MSVTIGILASSWQISAIILLLAHFESPPSTLKYLTELLFHWCVFSQRGLDRPQFVRDRWQAVVTARRPGDHNLFGISVHYEVRVVRNDYDLASLLRFSEITNQHVKYRSVVEVLLWLVNNEWAIVFDVKAKIEDEEYDAPIGDLLRG